MKPAAPVTRTVMRGALSDYSTCAATTSSAAEITKIFQAEPHQDAETLGNVAIGREGVVEADHDREAFIAVERADPADARFLTHQIVGIGAVGRPELVDRDQGVLVGLQR